MSRLLPPLSVSAVVFAAAWWAGSPPPVSSTTGNHPPAPAAAASSAGAESAAGGSALGRRAAFLAEMENGGPGDIRRLLEDSRLDGDAILDLSKRWAARDPAGFWQWLKGRSFETLVDYTDRNRDFWSELTRMAFETWFRADPGAAMAAWRKADLYSKQGASTGILASLFGGDESLRQKLLPYLDEIATGRIELSKLPGAGNSGDMAARLLKLPAGQGRDTLLAANARDWMDTDWKAASGWASALPEPLKSKMMAGLARLAFTAGSRVNPRNPQASVSAADPACFEWARQWFATAATMAEKKELGTQFVSTLSASDPAAALAWVNENLQARPMTRALGQILENQAAKDPAAARALVEGLPPGGVRQRAAFSAAGRPTPESVSWLIGQADKNDTQWTELTYSWAGSEPEVYRQYLESADLASLPEAMVRVGVQQLVHKDPSGTMDWVLQRKNPVATETALRMWGGSDPPAAAAWLKDHADATDWSGGIGTVTNGYFQRAPSDAVDWAASLPAGPVREAALGILRKSLAGNTALKAEERAAFEARLGRP